MKRLSITLAVVSLVIAVAGCGSTSSVPAKPEVNYNSSTVQAEEMTTAQRNGWTSEDLEAAEPRGLSKEAAVCVSLYEASHSTPTSSALQSAADKAGEECGK